MNFRKKLNELKCKLFNNHKEDKMKILIVIDAQNDLITGSLGNKNSIKAADIIAKKVKEATRYGTPIIFTKDTHDCDYSETFEGQNLPISHCIIGTEGWELEPRLDKIANYYSRAHIVYKNTFGSVQETTYGHSLENTIKTLLRDNEEETCDIEICGLYTDMSVVSNALILRAYDTYNISVDSSACCGSTPWAHEAALEIMKSCQIKVQ